MKTQKTRSIFAKTLVMATLAIGLYAAPASATIYNIGTVSSTPYINSVVLPAGNFLDNYNFSVSALANDVAASAVSLDLLLGNMSFLHINNLAFSLYDSSNTLIASSTGSPPAFDSVLGVGNYHFELAGQANGLSGGAYLFSVVAVPEPEQWALFAIGMGLLGVMSRRRANRS
ncbi:MAG: FxDxF family PEP-CTERM protein [Rugosibacter sp.]|jgi:hypothetical protein|nr:FxDxF family PEP-CTERM protein [Rugosibacter sp.]